MKWFLVLTIWGAPQPQWESKPGWDTYDECARARAYALTVFTNPKAQLTCVQREVTK